MQHNDRSVQSLKRASASSRNPLLSRPAIIAGPSHLTNTQTMPCLRPMPARKWIPTRATATDQSTEAAGFPVEDGASS